MRNWCYVEVVGRELGAGRGKGILATEDTEIRGGLNELESLRDAV